ncbi:glycosyltransferase family 4 protein [Helicobacter cinaedi]|uniref:glycosyltransferase family 4 protein n=1 Tax=Helicobacter cinaedi TaxID=213 RepID=UPI000CF04C4A|nr:MraY family glycosyltransferase [Helicobacter cinaedi]
MLLWALSSFLISFVLCVGIIIGSRRFGIFIDSGTSHKPQRFHTQATPRAGGIGIFSAFTLLVGYAYLTQIGLGINTQTLIILLGCGIVFTSGLIEDFSGNLSPKVRLIMQCVAAFGVCAWIDVYLKDLSLGFTLPHLIGLFFTTFALVGVSNAINIIDGFNGLASGVCLLILSGILYVAYDVKDVEIFYCALVLFFGILGFFVCNFPLGKIFLGDGGAYFLGFILGMLLVLLTQRHTESVSAFFGLSIMIYPVWEVVFSIWRKRFKRKMSATEPDKVHLHMLIFKRITHSNKNTSLVILACNVPFVILSVCFYQHTWLLLAFCGIFALLYGYFYARLIRFGM